MAKLNLQEANANLFRQVRARSRTDSEAAEVAVGGDFELIGTLEREFLIQQGLKADDYLIDVGCGSGRLTRALSQYLTGRYLGIDVVPELLDHARTQAPRPDWRFEAARGLSIPEKDAQADVVCFFSVFTHLYHEQSYTYLRDAKRVLKPGGRVVFSFTEFGIPAHWPWFEMALAEIGANLPPNVFIGRDAIAAWAEHLGFVVQTMLDGNKPSIRLPNPIRVSNGVAQGVVALGQSGCVLVKP